MNKKGELTTGGVVLIFVGIIVGIVLISAIAGYQNQVTALQSVTDETTDLSATGCLTSDGQVNESNSACNLTATHWYDSGDWRESESQCYLSSVTVGNSTTDLTSATDYNLYASSGLVQMLNTTETTNSSFGNDVLVDYSFCSEGYNKDGSSRSVAGLWTLFAALALVAFVLFGIREWINQR